MTSSGQLIGTLPAGASSSLAVEPGSVTVKSTTGGQATRTVTT